MKSFLYGWAPFFITLAIFAIIPLVFYAYIVIIRRKAKKSERMYKEQVSKLSPLFEKCTTSVLEMAGDRLLGTGHMFNCNNITFEQALSNQKFAINSVRQMF